MNTWNTLLESYQQRVYKNTLATVKHQIQQAENPTPAVVISGEAGHVDNANLHDYLTSEVALEQPEIGSTEPNITIHNNCTHDKLHFGMPRGSGDYEDEVDGSNDRDAIPTTSRRRWPVSQVERFHLGTSDDDGFEGGNGDDVDLDADEEEEALPADDGSTQNLGD